jgi:hypothetical protein
MMYYNRPEYIRLSTNVLETTEAERKAFRGCLLVGAFTPDKNKLTRLEREDPARLEALRERLVRGYKDAHSARWDAERAFERYLDSLVDEMW